MIRDNDEADDCPTQEFTPGEPSGKCWSDGHYECNSCQHLRPEFKDNWRLRSDVIEAQHWVVLNLTN